MTAGVKTMTPETSVAHQGLLLVNNLAAQRRGLPARGPADNSPNVAEYNRVAKPCQRSAANAPDTSTCSRLCTQVRDTATIFRNA